MKEPEYVYAGQVGWNTDCEDISWESTTQYDYYGEPYEDFQYVSRLRCSFTTVNAKVDYCNTCGRHIYY